MTSLGQYQTARTIARDVRMRRQVHKGPFILVEGRTDVLRFRKFFSEAGMFITCAGRNNVIGAVEQLYDDGFAGLVGLIDSDFDRIGSQPAEHEGLCYSATHDFDLDIVHSNVLERYLDEVADSAKILPIGGVEKIRDHVSELIKPLSALRYVNEKDSLQYRLDSIRHDDFFDGKNVDIDRLVETVSTGQFSSNKHKSTLKEKILKGCSIRAPLNQFTSGHDFCAALGITLRNELGNRRAPQTYRSEVEIHMRLAYDAREFDKSPVKSFCEKWQQENIGFKLLR